MKKILVVVLYGLLVFGVTSVASATSIFTNKPAKQPAEIQNLDASPVIRNVAASSSVVTNSNVALKEDLDIETQQTVGEIFDGRINVQVFDNDGSLIATIRAFVPVENSFAYIDRVKLIKDVLVADGTWDKFANLLGYKIDPIDIQLFDGPIDVDLRGGPFEEDDPNQLAFAWSYVNGICQLRIPIVDKIDYSEYKVVVAHELFHCYQAYLKPTRHWSSEQFWLAEASATWSMNYIYPSNNFEQKYFLNKFFSSRDKPLLYESYGNIKQYADYVFFLFLEQSDSEGLKNVANVIKEGFKKEVKPAILENIPDWPKKHAEFSFWNWNQEPFLKYKDVPNFPEIPISGQAYSSVKITTPGKITPFNKYAIDFGAAMYQRIEFDKDADIKKATFLFNRDARYPSYVQALVKINGKWRSEPNAEDWNDVKSKAFCFNQEDQKIDEIILIFSNYDIENASGPSFTLDTSGYCLKDSQCTKIVRVEYNRETNPFLGVRVVESGYSTYEAVENITYDSLHDAYFDGRFNVRTASAACFSNSKIETFRTIGSEESYELLETTVTGTTNGDYTLDTTNPILGFRYENPIRKLVYMSYNGNVITMPLVIVQTHVLKIGSKTIINDSIQELGTGNCGNVGNSTYPTKSYVESDYANGRLVDHLVETNICDGGTTTYRVDIDYPIVPASNIKSPIEQSNANKKSDVLWKKILQIFK